MGALAHADVAQVVNERVVGIVQIESRGAVAAADEIASMDEVDVLFVGPGGPLARAWCPRPLRR